MSFDPLEFRTVNTLWASVAVETLVRLGLTHAVISPGSRSTPLTLALARHPKVSSMPVLDERSAAFFALGLAKRTQRPTLLVCTSGTAGANYLPAIIEAHESGVPLIVLTADRPPELRDCASGQTIDQQKLFGTHVGWYHELAVPEANPDRLRYLRQMLVHGWSRAAGASPAPVHFNVPFRDPLVPDEGSSSLGRELVDPDFFSHLDCDQPRLGASTLWQRVTTARGVIVSGVATPSDPDAYVRHVLRLGQSLGWPILADVLSPLRTHAPSPDDVVTTYDTFLRDEATARELGPRQVLCLGGWPTSKVLRAWIERSQAEILLVSPTAANRDALHGKTRQITAPVESLAVEGPAIPDPSYAAAWKRVERATRSHLDETLARQEAATFEGRVAWTLARTLPAGASVFVASSMPVRDVEYFYPATGGKQRLYFNRGANGIDGTLSTACGLAHDGEPAVLLTGDLALLHDTNGFLMQAKLRGSLTILLINNAGGGIFEHLAIARHNPPFEEYFATPQCVDFGLLARAYGVDHRRVVTGPEITQMLEALPSIVGKPGIRVFEIVTDRKQDARFRKRLFAAAAAART